MPGKLIPEKIAFQANLLIPFLMLTKHIRKGTGINCWNQFAQLFFGQPTGRNAGAFQGNSTKRTGSGMLHGYRLLFII